jgi:sphingomyelin phosphodiesterase
LTFKNLANLGDKTFIRTLQDVCKKSKVEEADVCDGTIELQGPIIAEALRNVAIGSKTAQHFCVTFLGLCQYPAIEEWDVPLPPDRSHLKRPVPSGQDPIKVVHYSDIHVDQLYTEESNAKCNKPICCRPFTENDEPGRTDSPAGPFGEHTCDSPVSLEHSMYEAIKEIVPDAAFTIFTGDVVDHSIWNTTWDYNEHQSKYSLRHC